MKIAHRIAGEIQSLMFSTVLFLIRSMPYPLVVAVGKTLGILGWILDPLHRRISNLQIRHALGTRGEETLITKKVFINQVLLMIDALRFAYLDDDEIKKRVVIEGRENLEAVLSSGRGVLGITAHMNWEVLGNIPRLLGIEFCVMGRIHKNPRIQAIMEDIRSRCGFVYLPPKGGMVPMLIKELKKGRLVGFVIDQMGKRDSGLFCDFLGMPAPTNPAPAFIALKGDALVIPVATIKEGDHYRFRFEQPIDTRSYQDDYTQIDSVFDSWKSRAVQELSTWMQAWVSSVVREHPEQWLWLHSRWTRRKDMR
ncbi:MAG: lysophospholipid acyltransferase family protein, partial [Desulfomonilia bacterium]|nr:lysophospholipid acyltransferase family protein [Desulfomonilia bacterium]